MAYNYTNFYPVPAVLAGSSVADQRLTVDSTVGGLQFTAYTNQQADVVVLDVQTADVMCTFDGSAPTTTNGHRLYATFQYTWNIAAFNAAKFIAATATSGVVHASAFKL